MRGLILSALLLWLPSGCVASYECGGPDGAPCQNLCLFPSSVEVSGRTVRCGQNYPPTECMDNPDIRQYACANIRVEDGSDDLRITEDSVREELCKEMLSDSGAIFISSEFQTDDDNPGDLYYSQYNEWEERYTESSLKWLDCQMQEGGDSSDDDGGAVTLTFTGFVPLIAFGLLVNSFVNLRLM